MANDRERGGRALQRAIQIARARAGIPSDAALARLAPVSYDTLMNWYADKTRPRGAELQRVALALDVPYADLEAAYEGREPEPPALVDAVAELTDVVRELVAEIREDRERGQDAAAAILRAAGALRPNNGGAPASRERPVPDGSRG